MELALSQTCQTLRRVGKRIILTKLSPSSNQNNTNAEIPVRHFSKELSKDIQPYMKCTGNMHLTHPSLAYNKYITSSKLFLVPSGKKPNSNILARYFHDETSNTSLWISSTEIEEILSANEMPFHKKHTCFVTSCLDCCSNFDNPDKEFLTLYINAGSGNVICKQCGKKTTWNDLKKSFRTTASSENSIDDSPIFKFDILDKPIDHDVLKNSISIKDSNYDQLPQSYQCISQHIYNKYNVSLLKENDNFYFIFPYFDITTESYTGFKKVSTEMYDSKNLPFEITKSCSELGLFGWQTIDSDTTEIILCCNEFDSLAIAESLSIPTLSLPFGATTLPPDLLPFLEQFDHIILWFDNEYKSKENINQFSRKLGLHRCSVVNSSNEGSPFSILMKSGKAKVIEVFDSKRKLQHDHIVTFKELVDIVYNDLIHAKENAGVQFKRFPTLNDYLKGHRRGELTIFTGPTGSGKTTFLSELSLDLCNQGVRTLWGSFEIKNHRLVNILLHQYSGLKLEQNMEKFAEWSQSFQSLPFYFMTYYGAQDLSLVLQTIKYAVYNYDIEHVVIDNLQFMISVNRGEDRFVAMDKAIAAFRNCASEENIHITVVVHPRKESDGASLQTASIYGSAKASQEADNVLILQNNERLSMQISKNRYSGSIGTIPLKFNPDSLCLSGFYRNPLTGEEILPLLKPKRPVQKLKVFKKEKEDI